MERKRKILGIDACGFRKKSAQSPIPNKTWRVERVTSSPKKQINIKLLITVTRNNQTFTFRVTI